MYIAIFRNITFTILFGVAVGMHCYGENLNTTLVNDGWKFRLKPHTKAFSRVDFDDSTWQTVDLPHDWSASFDFSPDAPSGNDGGYLPTGRGAYRKVFPAGTFPQGKRHRIYFEGAYMDAKVYVNGDSVGSHPYGYTSFYIDITPYVSADSATTVAVSVDNSRQKNSRWFTGSGINRNVWLSQSPLEAEIEPWSLAVVSHKPNKKGDVVADVHFSVINHSSQNRSFKVRASIGENSLERNIDVPVGDTLAVSMPVKVRNARLWSPDSPALYPLNVSLVDAKAGIADSATARIGLRTFEYSAENGLSINGKPITLNGACVHHDNGILGAASYDDAEIHRVQMLKRAGFNAVRTSHNPPAPAFLAACDSIGLIVIDEAFDGWEEPKTPYDYSTLIGEWWADDLSAMVRRDRWHPSIFAWSIGNEILERKSPRAVELAGKFADLCRSLDPSGRPVTQAMAAWDSDWEIYDPLAAQHEIIGYNYMIHKAQSDHERVPSRIIWQTESYPRDVFPNWVQVHDYPYIIGDFVWTGIDYIGESGIGRHYYAGQVPGEHYDRDLWPWHGSECGDIDIIGNRKPVSHYRDILNNALADSVPTVYLAVREPNGYRGEIKETLWGTWPTEESWNWRGWEGKPIEVEVVSTLPEVGLIVNNEMVERKQVNRSTEFKATFTIPYAPGTIMAVGIAEDGSRHFSNVLTTARQPVALRVDVERPGSGTLAYVSVALIDEVGNVVPDADMPLLFEAEDDAVFLAAGSADMTDATGYHRPLRTTYRGRALAIFRVPKSSQASGARISAPSIPAATVMF